MEIKIDHLEIADIQKDDLAELSVLYEQLSGTKSDPIKMNVDYENMQRNGQYYLIGAKAGDKLVGSLMGIQCYDLVGQCFPFMVIENVIVLESQRGKGIGMKLFEQIEAIARVNKCNYLLLVSGQERTEAHLFYHAIGFAKDKVKGYKKFLK